MEDLPRHYSTQPRSLLKTCCVYLCLFPLTGNIVHEFSEVFRIGSTSTQLCCSGASSMEYLQNWPTFGPTCSSCKFGYKVAPHQLKIWSPGGTTCITPKCGYQTVSLELVCLATNCQSHTNKFFISYIHHHISLLVNLHVGHLIDHHVAPLVLVINLTTRWHHLY